MIRKKILFLSLLCIALCFQSTNISEASKKNNNSQSVSTTKMNIPVFPGNVLLWSNGQGFANFSAAYNPTKILIKNYSSRSVNYQIKINGNTIIDRKTLGPGKFVYEKIRRPYLINSESNYIVRMFTTDSSKRTVYVRAVGIQY